MSNLVEFAFEGSSVRVVMRDGEPWFVAADVAAVLGYSETHSMVRSLDDDEKGAAKLAAPFGGEQTHIIISESGLYSAVLRSKRPEAVPFRKWVTGEVLPSIRKTGAYVSESALTYENKASQALEAYNRAALLFGLSRNAALIAADNAISKRYAISFKDELGITLQAEDNEVPLLVSSIAEILGIQGGVVKRGKVVNDTLVALGFQIKLSNGDWLPLEAGAPYAFVSQTGKKHKDGTPVTQVKWKKSVVEIVRRALSV